MQVSVSFELYCQACERHQPERELFHLMVDAFGKPGMRARNLPKTCLHIAVLGHREPRPAAPPSLLPGMDLTGSRQHAADSSALILGVHLQMSYHKRLCEGVSQITINAPRDLEAAFLNGSKRECRWMRACQVCCNGVKTAGRISTALHQWCGLALGYHAVQTKSSL